MPRKPFPMNEEEKKRYQSIYQKFRKQRDVSDEEKVFFMAMRERLEKEGIPAVDPTVEGDSRQDNQTADDRSSAASVEKDAAQPQPESPPEKPSRKGKRRPPMEIKIPPDKLAAAVIAGAYAIEVENRKGGFSGMPDMWFPVAQQLLTDYFEELSAKGWDLRKFRMVILGGGFGVTAVQGIRRKVKDAKEKKTVSKIVENKADGAANGVHTTPTEEQAPPAPRSEIKEGDL